MAKKSRGVATGVPENERGDPLSKQRGLPVCKTCPEKEVEVGVEGES